MDKPRGTSPEGQAQRDKPSRTVTIVIVVVLSVVEGAFIVYNDLIVSKIMVGSKLMVTIEGPSEKMHKARVLAQQVARQMGFDPAGYVMVEKMVRGGRQYTFYDTQREGILY